MISTLEHIPWGGCEELWSRAALCLVEQGCRVTASVKAWPEVHRNIQTLSDAGVVVRRRTPIVYERLARRWRYPLASFLKRVPADLVVIAQTANTDGLGWMEACLEVGVPYVTIAQAAVPWVWPADDEAERLYTAYSGAKRAYFVSGENLALTGRQLGRDLANGVVVRNPFKVPYDVNLSWPCEASEARWGCVARLDTYIKGLDILFDVLSQDKWRGRPLKVTLYGTGSNARTLERMRADRNLSNVALGGFVSEPTDIWRKEHCLILPSRAEGLPLAIVEAMLCGRPCIVTGVSGNPELLQDNVTGFIAGGASVNEVDEAMERAWRRRDDWPLIGRRAAEAVRGLVPPDPARHFAAELLSLVGHRIGD